MSLGISKVSPPTGCRSTCWKAEYVRTQFHPSHDWSSWRPERGVLDALVGLCERTWPQPTTFTVELRTAKRTDEAESADEARQLLDTEGALTAATSIEVRAAGPHDSLNSLCFSWHRQSATLSVRASDEFAAAALALVASAIVTSNTYAMNDIIERHEAASRVFDDVDLARLSPVIQRPHQPQRPVPHRPRPDPAPANARPRHSRDLPLNFH